MCLSPPAKPGDLKAARTAARQTAEAGDDGTNDLLVSDVIRTNELQVWLLAEQLVDVPLVRADGFRNGLHADGGSGRRRKTAHALHGQDNGIPKEVATCSQLF